MPQWSTRLPFTMAETDHPRTKLPIHEQLRKHPHPNHSHSDFMHLLVLPCIMAVSGKSDAGSGRWNSTESIFYMNEEEASDSFRSQLWKSCRLLWPHCVTCTGLKAFTWKIIIPGHQYSEIGLIGQLLLQTAIYISFASITLWLWICCKITFLCLKKISVLISA